MKEVLQLIVSLVDETTDNWQEVIDVIKELYDKLPNDMKRDCIDELRG